MNHDDFNNLILLVGTNPLPNFVVADYFLQKNPGLKSIYLIHSQENKLQAGTDIQADQLEEVLQGRWENQHAALKFPLKRVSLSDVSDSATIQHDLQEPLLDDLSTDTSIHLNYTGGTKSMSTHVYLTLQKFLKPEQYFCSYLDGRNFRLMEDYQGIQADRLREQVHVTFEELIKLHGFEKKKEQHEDFPKANKVFHTLIQSGDIASFYSKKGGYHRSLFLNKKGSLAERVGQLDMERLKSFTPNDVFINIVKQMPEDSRIFKQDKTFNTDISRRKLGYALKFLDGFWFEEYCAKSFQQNLHHERVQIETNWKIRKPDWPKRVDFELDVLLLYGYQLTGVSCTTSSRKYLCKSKGFEIIHRTRQIGGDEAKAALVTFLDKTTRDSVQEELLVDTGSKEGSILVLGYNDLQEEQFIKKFREFILP